jgi:hypothetical protein
VGVAQTGEDRHHGTMPFVGVLPCSSEVNTVVGKKGRGWPERNPITGGRG